MFTVGQKIQYLDDVEGLYFKSIIVGLGPEEGNIKLHFPTLGKKYSGVYPIDKARISPQERVLPEGTSRDNYKNIKKGDNIIYTSENCAESAVVQINDVSLAMFSIGDGKTVPYEKVQKVTRKSDTKKAFSEPGKKEKYVRMEERNVKMLDAESNEERQKFLLIMSKFEMSMSYHGKMIEKQTETLMQMSTTMEGILRTLENIQNTLMPEGDPVEAPLVPPVPPETNVSFEKLTETSRKLENVISKDVLSVLRSIDNSIKKTMVNQLHEEVIGHTVEDFSPSTLPILQELSLQGDVSPTSNTHIPMVERVQSSYPSQGLLTEETPKANSPSPDLHPTISHNNQTKVISTNAKLKRKHSETVDLQNEVSPSKQVIFSGDDTELNSRNWEGDNDLSYYTPREESQTLVSFLNKFKELRKESEKSGNETLGIQREMLANQNRILELMVKTQQAAKTKLTQLDPCHSDSSLKIARTFSLAVPASKGVANPTKSTLKLSPSVSLTNSRILSSTPLIVKPKPSLVTSTPLKAIPNTPKATPNPSLVTSTQTSNAMPYVVVTSTPFSSTANSHTASSLEPLVYNIEQDPLYRETKDLFNEKDDRWKLADELFKYLFPFVNEVIGRTAMGNGPSKTPACDQRKMMIIKKIVFDRLCLKDGEDEKEEWTKICRKINRKIYYYKEKYRKETETGKLQTTETQTESQLDVYENTSTEME